MCAGLPNESGLFCEKYCPTGYGSSNSCTVKPGLIFSLSFSSLNAASDTVNGLKGVLKGSPRVLYQQGLQLEGQQWIELPPNSVDSTLLVLAATHYAEMWIRPVSGGTLLSKFIGNTNLLLISLKEGVLTVSLQLYSFDVPADMQVGTLYVSTQAALLSVSGGKIAQDKTWSRVGYSVALSGSGTSRSTTLSLYVDGKVVASSSKQAFFRDFNAGSFYVGTDNEASYFVGQLAELQLSNGVSTPPSLPPCACPSCSAAGMCLAPCANTEYLSVSSCLACDSSCGTNGCLRKSDCRLNLDPLCIRFSDFSGCEACGNLAKLVKSGCICVDDAVYLSASASCACAQGFQQSGTACAACLVYFKSSDVTAAFATSYMQVVVTFAKPVVSGLETCSDIFASDIVAKLGSSPICVFDSARQVLTVQLGAGTSLVQEPMSLLNKRVVAAQGTCNNNIESLAPLAKYPSKPVTPTAQLAGPGQYSTICGSSALILSAAASRGAQGRQMLYKWTFVTSPPTFSVNDYSDFSADNMKISLPNSILQNTKLSVTLTVKNFFDLEDSVTKTIEVVGSSALAVEIQGGSSASVKVNSRASFKAQVNSSCGNSVSSYSFLWSLISGTIEADLNLARNPLILPANSLKPGQSYTFQVTATDSNSGVSGIATLSVTAASGPVKAQCNRSDGQQSKSKNLVIDCSKSKDTDDPDATNLKVVWVCVQNSGSCKDASGGVLDLASASSLILNISNTQLLSGATYVFTLSVSKDTRSDSVSLRLTIIEATSLEVAISLEKRQYSPKEDIQATTSISGADPALVTSTWTQTSGPALTTKSSSSAFTLSIGADTTQSGATYVFTLTVTSGTGPAMSASITIQMALPPSGGSASVHPTAGTALSDDFTFAQNGWVSGNLPLQNSVLYSDAGEKKSFLVPSQADQRSTKLFTGKLDLFFQICDSLNSCAEVSVSVQVAAPGRRLAADLQSSFDSLTGDLDHVPAVCVIFGKSVVLQQALWEHILAKLVTWIGSFEQLDTSQTSAAVNCLAILASQRLNSNNFQALITAVNRVQTSYSSALTLSVFTAFFELFSRYPLTSDKDQELLKAYYDTLQDRYLASSLPNDSPVAMGAQSIGFYFARKTGDMLATEIKAASLNFTVQIPSALVQKKSEVWDLRATQFIRPGFPVGILELTLQQIGTYELAFVKRTSSLLDQSNLIQPINVSLPVFNNSAHTYMCVCEEAESWVTTCCQVLKISNNSAEVQVWRLGIVTVVEKDSGIFVPEQLPLVPFQPSQDCDMWLAPTYIMATLLGVLVISLLSLGGAALALRKPAEQEAEQAKPEQIVEINPPEMSLSEVHISVPGERSEASSGQRVLRVELSESIEVPQEGSAAAPLSFRLSIPDERSSSSNPDIIVPDERSVASDHHARVPDEGPVASDVPIPASLPSDCGALVVQPQVADKTDLSRLAEVPKSNPEVGEKIGEELSPLVRLVEGHYLLGLVVVREWPRWQKALCLVTALMSELFFLGVFYYYLQDSRDNGQELSSASLWKSYSGDDALLFFYSILISWVVSAGLGALFNVSQRKKARLGVSVSVGLSAVLLVFFAVLVVLINRQLCYEYAGRWCIGFLWCVIAELFLLEPIFAILRLLLLMRREVVSS